MAYHAEKSPSSAHRWGGVNGCTASIKAQRGMPNKSGAASRRGTCGHQMCAEVLLGHTDDLQGYLGRTMWWDDEGYEYFTEDWPHGDEEPAEETVVDQELIDQCWMHVDMVRETQRLLGAELYVEERVPIDHITGEPGATGTSDTVLIAGKTCIIMDLKLGRGRVEAYEIVQHASTDIITGELIPEIVEPNEQLAMYCSGTIEKFSAFYDIEDVTLVISQPPLNHTSQWAGTVEELNVTIDRLRAKARECDENPTYNPTPDNCHFCRAAGPSCEAQTKMVLETTLQGFEDVETVQPKPIKQIELGTLYAHLPLIQSWCKNLQSQVSQTLTAGIPVVRSDGLSYKLVEGRAGRRQWRDKDEVVRRLKGMRIPDDAIYERSLISPAKAEELAKSRRPKAGEPKAEPLISKLQWTRLQQLMSQSHGKPTVALETDPRPAVATTDGFEDVPTAEDELNSDLF